MWGRRAAPRIPDVEGRPGAPPLGAAGARPPGVGAGKGRRASKPTPRRVSTRASAPRSGRPPRCTRASAPLSAADVRPGARSLLM